MIMQERECGDKQGHERGGAWMRKQVEKREKMKMLGEKHRRQMTMMKKRRRQNGCCCQDVLPRDCPNKQKP